MRKSPQPRGLYNWLVPLALGVMVLILLAIVVALLGALFGLWPTA
jgi:hypothetical protein